MCYPIIQVVFTPHVPVFFLSSWHNFGDIEVKFRMSCLVSSPGRDSRDSRSSRLAEATQKALGTNALSNWFRCMYLVPSSHLSNIYKIVF